MKNVSIKLLAFVATSVFISTQASTIDNNDVLKEVKSSVQHSTPVNSSFITIAQLQNFNDEVSRVRCSPYPGCKYQFSNKEMKSGVQHVASINFTSTALFINSPLITIAQLQHFNDEASQVRCSPYPGCKYEFGTQKETNNT
ncbi:MAG: hypothetical protein HRT38_15110 [Alteromonadaceae bacterium]|nr:hypothetical protein [Alteromonadaceae bacterium]